jgi:hypothetical protein
MGARRHYGIPGVTRAPDDWRRVDGARAVGRGGILGLAAVLAAQSGASRTSPILRGNWVSEVLLGERCRARRRTCRACPRTKPPARLSVRELDERHSSDPRCAHCHVRIDRLRLRPRGYDAIGRHRSIATSASGRSTPAHRGADGAEFDGLAGLRDYLLHTASRRVRAPVLPQAARLRPRPRASSSPTPLLDTMLAPDRRARLPHRGAIESIVRAPVPRDPRSRLRPK